MILPRGGSTVYLLSPLSNKGREWVEEHVNYESYQQLGSRIVIEARYIGDILAGMAAAGLKNQEDYDVTNG